MHAQAQLVWVRHDMRYVQKNNVLLCIQFPRNVHLRFGSTLLSNFVNFEIVLEAHKFELAKSGFLKFSNTVVLVSPIQYTDFTTLWNNRRHPANSALLVPFPGGGQLVRGGNVY